MREAMTFFLVCFLCLILFAYLNDAGNFGVLPSLTEWKVLAVLHLLALILVVRVSNMMCSFIT